MANSTFHGENLALVNICLLYISPVSFQSRLSSLVLTFVVMFLEVLTLRARMVSACSSYLWYLLYKNDLYKEIVFSPLYSLASFVKDKVSIGAWVYLWAFHFVPLIYISVFVPVPYCLDDCGFVVEPEVRQVDSSSSILLSQDCFGFVVHLKLTQHCESTILQWK